MTDGPFSDDFGSDDPPLDPRDEAVLAAALSAAYTPHALDAARHAEILALALEDPFAPATDDELRESARLRQALEHGDDTHADAVLARALATALRPAPLPRDAATRAVSRTEARKPNVVYVTFGAVALAAALFALFVLRPRTSGAPVPSRVLVSSRTTEPLFHHGFADGNTTERIDRIASARERDARENRYARWGVR